MKTTIQALVELQRIDDEIATQARQRDELKANLTHLQSIVDKMDAELGQMKEKLSEATGFYKEKQIDLEADAERLARAKQKLGGVTRTKEYAAIQREIDTLRRKYTEDEAELNRLAQAIEEYKASISEQKKKVAELNAEVKRESDASSERLAELEGAIGGIESRKKSTTKELPSTLVKRYARILKQREGKAVVPVDNGRCTGCQMVLPPQMYVLVQRGETLESCPSCQRYLFVEEYPEANFNLDELGTHA